MCSCSSTICCGKLSLIFDCLEVKARLVVYHRSIQSGLHCLLWRYENPSLHYTIRSQLAEQGKLIISCPRSRLRIFGLSRWVRQSHLASACSSPYSRLNLVLAYGISPEFRCGVHSLSVHTNMYYECSSTYMYTYYVR